MKSYEITRDDYQLNENNDGSETLTIGIGIGKKVYRLSKKEIKQLDDAYKDAVVYFSSGVTDWNGTYRQRDEAELYTVRKIVAERAFHKGDDGWYGPEDYNDSNHGYHDFLERNKEKYYQYEQERRNEEQDEIINARIKHDMKQSEIKIQPLGKTPGMTPQSKEDFKKNAANAVMGCLSDKSYVFGGYVRDTMAGRSFEDMDLHFDSRMELVAFEQRLNKLGYKLKFISKGKYATHATHEKFHITKDGETNYLKLDVTNPFAHIAAHDLTAEQKMPVKDDYWDADIHTLAMSKDRIVFCCKDRNMTHKELAELKNRAYYSQFIAMPGMTEERRQKLLKKGYKELVVLPAVTSPAMAIDKIQWEQAQAKVKKEKEEKDAKEALAARQAFDLEKSLNAAFNGQVSKTTITKEIFGANVEDFKNLESLTTVGETSKSQKGQKKMSDKQETIKEPDMFEMLTAEMHDAKWRVAAKAMTDGTKNLLVMGLQSKGMESDKIKAVAEALDSEYGAAAIGMLLGVLIHNIPQMNADPRARRLAKEFRTKSMETVGNELVGLATGSLIPMMKEAMKSLPTMEEPKLRVPHHHSQPAAEMEDEEEEMVASAPAKKKGVGATL